MGDVLSPADVGFEGSNLMATKEGVFHRLTYKGAKQLALETVSLVDINGRPEASLSHIYHTGF